jgi:hypothetical protein
VSYIDDISESRFHTRAGSKLLVRVRYDCCGREATIRFCNAKKNERNHNNNLICRYCNVVGKLQSNKYHNDLIEMTCENCKKSIVICRTTYKNNVKRNGRFICKSCAISKPDSPTNDKNQRKPVDVICENCGGIEQIQYRSLQRRLATQGRCLCQHCIINQESTKIKRQTTNLIRRGIKKKSHKEFRQLDKIEAMCNHCKKIIIIRRRTYNRNVIKNDKFICRSCFHKINHWSKGELKQLIREKIEKTNLKKYGVKCAAQNDKIKEKAKNTCFTRYGDLSPGLSIRNVSKAGTRFLDDVENLLRESLLREVWMGRKIKVDGYHKLTKTVIEFNGNFFHCDPKIWKPEDRPFKANQITASFIWQRDADRIRNLESRGYHVIVVWEQDYRTNPEDTVEKVVTTIRGREADVAV